MKSLFPHFLMFNGCLWLVTTGEAVPGKKLPPTLPPHSQIRHKVAPVPRPTARKLPPSESHLSAKPSPRPPSKVAATGRTNPDRASIGLADQRLREDATAPEFSLEDAIALSLAHNPRLDEAQAAVNAATSNIGAVGSQGKLQVNANGSTEYGRNTSTSNAIATPVSSGSGSSTGSGGSGGGSGGGSSSAPSPSRSFLRFDQLTIGASQPITTGGRVKASTRQARYQAVAQIYQLAQTEQDLILETTLAYLDVLRSGQLLRVTNANLSVSQERLRIARLRYSVGASARLDVLQAETALADARSRRIQAVNSLGSSNAGLNILLGRAPETPIRLVTISRLNLPDVAYGIKPSSVLPTSQTGQAQPNGTGSQTSQNGSQSGGNSGTGNSNRGGTANGGAAITGTGNNGRGTTANQANNSLPATGGTGAGNVFSGPSAPAGGSSSSSNSTIPLGGANTTNPLGASGSTGNSPAAGSTNPTGAANPSGATTSSGMGSSGGATATTGGTTSSSTGSGSTSGSTSNLSSGSVPSGASSGLQTVAGGTRESLAVTQAQIGAAQAAIEIAKSGKRPQLGLNLSALLRNPATFLGNFGASIGLGLAQNLFDSGRTKNQVATAQSALDQLQAHLAGQRLEVASAIETSLLALDSAQRRQSNSEAGVRSASEALRVAQIGFRSGVRTTLDLADAQAALLSAQTDAVNARFDIADSQATLAAAVGIYTVEAQKAREKSIPQQKEAATQAKKQIDILQPAPKKKRRKFLGIF